MLLVRLIHIQVKLTETSLIRSSDQKLSLNKTIIFI